MMTQRSEPEPTMLEIDGGQEPAYNMSDAAVYLGASQTTLQNILKRRRKEGREITQHQRGFGQEKFLLKKDLDDLLRGRPSTH